MLTVYMKEEKMERRKCCAKPTKRKGKNGQNAQK